MSDLDIGTLVAKLRLDGADDYNRDVDRARNAFSDLADEARTADRQISQLSTPRGLADIRRDSSQAQDSLNELGTSGRRTSTQLAGVGDGMGTARRQIASDTQAARRDIEQLGDSARRTGNDIQDAAGQSGNAFRDELGRMQGDAGDGGEGGGLAFVGGFGEKLKGLAGKGGPWGAVLAGVAIVGAAAGAKLAELTMQGFEIDAERRFAAAKFGWSDSQLEQAGLAAGNAYGENFGESVQSNIEGIGAAIQTGLLDGNATADDMQPVIEKLATVSDLLGTEIPETARAAGQMVKTGLAKDASEAMDLLTVASQKGLNISDDLLDTVTEYGTQYRKLGLDGATALGTIAQMMQGGARDTDLAADALKEFSLRVIDGSESTKDAYTSLGLNVDDTAEAFGKGGKSAAAMADTVIDKLRSIKDPVERNRIGVELFGSQWEDLGGAINNMDLTKAAGELGKVGGAADNAASRMSGGAASIESVRRKIEVFADNAKLKLAEIFGPSVQQAIDGLVAHKDEIIGFLKAVVGTALQTGVVFGNMAAGMLHAWAAMTRSLAPLVGGLVGMFGKAWSAIGTLVSKIPGMGDVGDTIKSVGDTAQKTGAAMNYMADAADGTADFIADSLVPALANAKSRLSETGENATGVTGRLGFLKDSLVSLPDGKSIVISDNSPETKDRLEKLGYTVTTLPDGTVQVTANTEQAKKDVAYLTSPRTMEVLVTYKAPDGSTVQAPASAPRDATGKRLPGRAGGGQVFGPGGPRDDAFLVPLSNREFVHRVAAVDYYGVDFMSAVNEGRFPRVLARGYADGGQVTDDERARMGGGTVNLSIWEAVKANNPGAVLTAAKTDHDVDGGLHPKGEAIDVDPSQKNIDFAWSIRDQLAMIITQNDLAKNWYSVNGEKAEGQAAVNIYGADVVAQHANHTHLGALHDVTSDGAAAQGKPQQTIKDITLTKDSSREDVARKIIAEGRKRGYTDAQIADILSAAIQESNLDPNASNPAGWDGIFQQDSSYPGRNDPNTQITGFYDRLDEKKTSPGWSQNMDDNIFWLQQRPGEKTAQSAVANGRSGYMDEINSHQDEANNLLSTLGPSVGTTTDNATTTTATPDGLTSGSTVNAFVTNWPSKIADAVTSTTTGTPKSTTTPTGDKTKPSGPLPLVAYADGGWGGPDAATMLDDARAWVTLAGEAGRELFLPINGSAKSKAMWVQAGRELGMLRAYADGGFGGYSDDTSDWMAPKSWQDYAYLAAGAGFTAASVIGPYAAMAASFSDGAGEITLSDIAPQPQTGSNDIPGLSSAIQKLAEPLASQIAELKKAVAEGKQVHVIVNDRKGLLEKSGIHLAGMS